MDEELEPAQFYTGLVAEIYRHLRGETPDPAIYDRFVRRHGEPALELGCGDGDPMLDLVDAGLHVEGLDASADMLERCRVAAAARGLDVVLHHDRFESMDLGRTFRSIYVAGATLNLLPDDESLQQALHAIARHLDPQGAAIVSFWIPAATAADVTFVKETTRPDGTVMRFSVLGRHRDEEARNDIAHVRYELVRDGTTTATERMWHIHWVVADDVMAMVAAAGLQVRRALTTDGGPLRADAEDFTLVLEHRAP